jgi:hypothetical protein
VHTNIHVIHEGQVSHGSGNDERRDSMVRASAWTTWMHRNACPYEGQR